jgi:hypothetical protein
MWERRIVDLASRSNAKLVPAFGMDRPTEKVAKNLATFVHQVCAEDGVCHQENSRYQPFNRCDGTLTNVGPLLSSHLFIYAPKYCTDVTLCGKLDVLSCIYRGTKEPLISGVAVGSTDSIRRGECQVGPHTHIATLSKNTVAILTWFLGFL